MKYFFLSEGWTIGRVWELGGLWNERAWRRQPQIEQMQLSIIEQDEILHLYQVEEAVLMVEIRPIAPTNPSGQPIGQVVLKRLMTAEQAIAHLNSAEKIFSA